MSALSLFSPVDFIMQALSFAALYYWSRRVIAARRFYWLLCALVLAMLTAMTATVVHDKLAVIADQHHAILAAQARALDAQANLLQSHQNMLELQGQILTLQGKVIDVQSRIVDGFETELYLISIPQAERPRLPMPVQLREKLYGGAPY